jgi:ABC-type antimicrobial peptide transport system permease subunit
LQWGSRLATLGRGAATALALAQMARSPRQSLRMTFILSLATAFAIFTLVFTATQDRRIFDVANHQSGADFSGTIASQVHVVPLPVSPAEVKQRTMDYRHIAGVISATVGYAGQVTAGKNMSIELRAVDADTFARTAIWTEQNSSQSLTALMTQLSTRRTSALASNVVPAIVDDNLWIALGLSTARRNFTLKLDAGSVNFMAIARVNLIPTVNDSNEQGIPGSTVATGGVLADYSSCYTVYAQSLHYTSSAILPLNYAWLRTQGDAPSLVNVRKALGTVDLRADRQLDPLIDRRAIISSLQQEPLYLTLIGVLSLGATMALLLALLGCLIASWLNARSRLINFAVLRALGAVPQQLASLLIWEQSIIYTTALLLGMIFGVVLSALVVPTLIFTSVNPESGGNLVTNGQFYALQNIPPVQMIVPASLGTAIGVFVVICVVALGMMFLVIVRPSISQTLRLNQD